VLSSHQSTGTVDPDSIRIVTPRLLLRALRPGDLFPLAEVANDAEISRWTTTVPHPYTVGDAAKWIMLSRSLLAAGDGLPLAVVLGQTLSTADGRSHAAGTLVAMAGLILTKTQPRAELGYWVGRDFRSLGIASEAAGAVIDYGFGTLGLARIFAGYFDGNEGSERVMRRVGMTAEGVRRCEARKNGAAVDINGYAITRNDWLARRQAPT
jgi:[ribosomal protein S5]-alanine N-acetyltransferase